MEMTGREAYRFDEVIEAVESLPPDYQEALIGIIRMRLIQRRRAELAAEIAEAREDYRQGRVRRGTVSELMVRADGGAGGLRALVWSRAFVRAFRRAVRRSPELRERAERALKQLAEDPFHPGLRSHKLNGELSGALACHG